ncbi:MAG: DUF4401 domain-containing protein [Vulcanimicrobiota bacterium]
MSEITIDRVVGARAAGQLSAEKYDTLLRELLSPPPPHEWLTTVRHWLLVSGLLLLVSGLILFGAYNWELMSRLQKLGLLQVILVALFSGVLLRGLEKPEGKVLLVAASGLVGALLAVLGYAYPTGADSYSLFLSWALLILPWCLAGRLNALWVLELALLDVAFTLWWYQRVNLDFDRYSVGFLLFNLLLAGLWYFARQKAPWMDHQPGELLLFSALVPATLAGCFFLMDADDGGYSLVLLGLVLAGLIKYRGTNLLFMATVAASLFCLVTTLVGRLLLQVEFIFSSLFLGLFVMAEIALIVKWLTPLRVQKEESREERSPNQSEFPVDLSEEDLAAIRAAGEFPWYVHGLVGGAAWLASLFVLLFFLIFIWESPTVLYLYGLLLYGGSLWFSRVRKPPFFLRHSLLSVHISGILVTAAGVARTDDGLAALVAALLFLASARFYDEVLGGFVFGFGFFLSGMIAAQELIDRLRFPLREFSTTIEIARGTGFVLWCFLIFFLLVQLATHLRRLLRGRLKAQILPILRGLSAGLLATALFFDFSELHDQVLSLAVGAVAVLLWQSTLLGHPLLVRLALLIAGALTYSVPSLAISVFVYLVGFQHRQQFIQGLALVSLAAAGTLFYYNLDYSIISKSLILLSSGSVLLASRLLTGMKLEPEEDIREL